MADAGNVPGRGGPYTTTVQGEARAQNSSFKESMMTLGSFDWLLKPAIFPNVPLLFTFVSGPLNHCVVFVALIKSARKVRAYRSLISVRLLSARSKLSIPGRRMLSSRDDHP